MRGADRRSVNALAAIKTLYGNDAGPAGPALPETWAALTTDEKRDSIYRQHTPSITQTWLEHPSPRCGDRLDRCNYETCSLASSSR